MRQIVFDTETTGLDPAKGHRIVEIGCVEVMDRSITDNYFHVYINPDRDIDPGALSVHGLTVDFLSDKPIFKSIVSSFIEFIRDAELIAHNASFDVKFIDSELNMAGMGPLISYCSGVVDSLDQARKLRPGKRNSLDALCDFYNISNKDRVLHGALLDARLLANVWLSMTRGQDELIINNKSNSYSGKNLRDNRFYLNLPVLKATTEEQKEHDNYIEDLQKIDKKVTWP
ncbi:DNA polymerase III subunit epsilon [Candidatus Kinetoplastibacterium blastocrithidii TCC012E]|uniref:DNA polymerase III subunit epsilon n=1 Tax=Candidatus Kinetoplastidibacterium blastocrithidiae TCC012E TaxID=1208922 RepID=M1ME59_9PROT|nr:DNA polymerase III subunit epsilon [Candidatus Kinetoplastibacterium blastocrithidii]AFZ83201.1 DNA polymerase III subunit epsilon [Candidatus Kinetoplastibacterium blastocrithidii (ex Strigomonas culicis)]AGF50015.1 DNA polymerase III subunit epsilon [Candidatus Kinetoplastibacterium blastocrithidii TCC012E]